MQWTRDQQTAIEARGGTLLVSAAAGSGKTAVLVERVLQRLEDPVNGCAADELLIVTFTKAATTQMASVQRAICRKASFRREMSSCTSSTPSLSSAPRRTKRVYTRNAALEKYRSMVSGVSPLRRRVSDARVLSPGMETRGCHFSSLYTETIPSG